MTFKQHIANYVTGNLTTSQLPLVGLAGLEQGLESDSLNILAGMSKNDNLFELEDYFTRALTELKVELPDKREAALQLTEYYADEIIEGKLDPVDGLHKIIRNALGSYDFFKETKKYVMDSIDFASIYGLYWTYDDLRNANRPWSKEKSNDILMQEVKAEIIKEIKEWRTKRAATMHINHAGRVDD